VSTGTSGNLPEFATFEEGALANLDLRAFRVGGRRMGQVEHREP
jgi:hypothetical protein